MNGPEHYHEAERLLRSCQLVSATADNAAIYPELEEGVNTTANALAAAQVHAMLALAAATVGAFTRSDSWADGMSVAAWARVIEP